MKRGLIVGIVTGIILLIGIVYYNNREVVNLEVNKMQIKSIFEQGEKIPVKYTAQGNDVNPPLEISGVPSGTKNLVLIVDDPDAPAGNWVHWIVFNIPVSVNKIEEGSVPPGIVGVNSWGRNYYGGPNPPSGTHRYFFKVYAIDVELDLDESADKAEVLNAIEGHILDKGKLMGVYSKE